MSNEHDENTQSNNQQTNGGTSGSGKIPDSDPNLSDYHRRDAGDSQNIVIKKIF
jgi:hypothetical protein